MYSSLSNLCVSLLKRCFGLIVHLGDSNILFAWPRLKAGRKIKGQLRLWKSIPRRHMMLRHSSSNPKRSTRQWNRTKTKFIEEWTIMLNISRRKILWWATRRVASIERVPCVPPRTCELLCDGTTSRIFARSVCPSLLHYPLCRTTKKQASVVSATAANSCTTGQTTSTVGS